MVFSKYCVLKDHKLLYFLLSSLLTKSKSKYFTVIYKSWSHQSFLPVFQYLTINNNMITKKTRYIRSSICFILWEHFFHYAHFVCITFQINIKNSKLVDIIDSYFS